jgi:hypothetical protein
MVFPVFGGGDTMARNLRHPMRTMLVSFLLLTLACSTKGGGDTSALGIDDTGDRDGDGDGPGDDSETGQLAGLSDGECPDLTKSGTEVFSSSGSDRTVTTVIPSNFSPGMPLVFFFHGLLDASMSSPSEYHVDILGLQTYADEMGVVIVLPESAIMSVMGFSFYMWTVDVVDGEDIILYDDLRTCAVQQLEIDLDRIHAVGFSGGALFTTVVARDRGDTLASIVEMSGGSDLVLPTFTDLFSEYDTPAYAMPALLMTGGENDVWPNASFTLVDFVAATDNLQSQLVDDSHFVVRCDHGGGHTVTNDTLNVAWGWVEAHVFGEPSPFIDAGIEDFGSWCAVAD